jgi:hypothetical protein
MKVFLSWSGDLSHSVALILRDWLPSVIQDVDPYVSSEDIDKGTRWSTDIAKELEASAYGILCITPENLVAPWIHFEAGALSKQIDKSRVCPFLFRVKRAQVDGPLLQFQSTIYDHEDVNKLIASLNNAMGPKKLEEQRLSAAFDVWWPLLQQKLDGLPQPTKLLAGMEQDTPPRSSADTKMLEEVLDLVRTQQKILRSPSELLPLSYLQQVLPPQAIPRPVDETVWFEVTRIAKMMRESSENVLAQSPQSESQLEQARLFTALSTRLNRLVAYVDERVHRPEQRFHSDV